MNEIERPIGKARVIPTRNGIPAVLLRIGPTRLFTWRPSIDDVLQLGLDGQTFEHADVSATSVANWNSADRRAQCSQNDAYRLTQNCRKPTSPQLDLQHQPMRCDVWYDVFLADNVSSLEMSEARFQVARGNETLRLSDFAIEGRTLEGVHCRFPCDLRSRFRHGSAYDPRVAQCKLGEGRMTVDGRERRYGSIGSQPAMGRESSVHWHSGLKVSLHPTLPPKPAYLLFVLIGQCMAQEFSSNASVGELIRCDAASEQPTTLRKARIAVPVCVMFM